LTPPVPWTGSATSAAMLSAPISATVRSTAAMSSVDTRAVSGTRESVPYPSRLKSSPAMLVP
jgi:hypothetical protein